MTLGNICINTCNSSNVAWYLSDKCRNVKDLITSFFDTGIDACLQILCTFNGKRSNFLEELFILKRFQQCHCPLDAAWSLPQ